MADFMKISPVYLSIKCLNGHSETMASVRQCLTFLLREKVCGLACQFRFDWHEISPPPRARKDARQFVRAAAVRLPAVERPDIAQ